MKLHESRCRKNQEAISAASTLFSEQPYEGSRVAKGLRQRRCRRGNPVGVSAPVRSAKLVSGKQVSGIALALRPSAQGVQGFLQDPHQGSLPQAVTTLSYSLRSYDRMSYHLRTMPYFKSCRKSKPAEVFDIILTCARSCRSLRSGRMTSLPHRRGAAARSRNTPLSRRTCRSSRPSWAWASLRRR